MAFTQDQLIHLISIAFGQGAGATAGISPEGAEALRYRYSDWLVSVKAGNTQTPLEVWDERGADFLSRVRKIGQIAVSLANGGQVGEAEVSKAAAAVEQTSDCPFCP
jgi:hypothetical protein